jgi:hypothetical protein
LAALIYRIVKKTDAAALNEFHQHRTPFLIPDGPRVRFTQYIDWLRDQRAGVEARVTDRAYDLTLDKFSRLPVASDDKHRRGPDCRIYFRAFLEHLRGRAHEPGAVTTSQDELLVARELQYFVRRHFALSLNEAWRGRNPAISRYFWKLPPESGHALCLWLPRSIRGRARRQWLEHNAPDADPTRPGERERIQAIINQRLLLPSVGSLNACADVPARNATAPGGEAGLPTRLAQAVADEKAATIELQRPAIQKLGPSRLRELVLAAFRHAEDPNETDEILAGRFGLSKSAFSRFAGAQWKHRGRAVLPDLWLNTARTLRSCPDFADAARASGIWETVLQMQDRKNAQTDEEA